MRRFALISSICRLDLKGVEGVQGISTQLFDIEKTTILWLFKNMEYSQRG